MAARKTAQREAIRQVFDAIERPLEVEEVLARAREHVPSMNRATVYRNLKRLVEEGALIRIEYPPRGALYERAGKPHHHHFHCRGCETLQELPGCAIDESKTLPPGYRVEGHEVFIYGLCDRCSP